MLENKLSEQEKISLEDHIASVEKLLEGKENPRAFELGLLLALKLGLEIRDKKPLGSESGDLVASWSGVYPESVVEEAIASAREFILHPAKLAENIKGSIAKMNEKPEESSETSSEASDGE